METGDPRQRAFSASRFRDGIEFAMQMGLPQTESERATFLWKDVNTYSLADSKGSPYDWTQPADTTVSAPDVPSGLTVPITLEFFDSRAASGDTVLGDFDKSRIKIFMLDTSYAIIMDQNLGLPDSIIADGNTYDIEYWAPPSALFDVTTYTVYATARDET